MVGLGGLEPPTSPLSGVRSSHLSYRPSRPSLLQNGGADRSRTDDLLNASQALSQLSYSPSDGKRRRAPAINIRGRLDAAADTRPAGSGLIKTRSRDSGTMEWNGCHLLDRQTARFPNCGISVTPPTFSLRKEVIQPQVLLRLPCYDFTPIMNHTLGRCLPCGLACRLLVQSTFVM